MEHSSKPLRIRGSANQISFNDSFVKSKEQIRKEHAEGLRIFLKNGGVVQKIPSGVSGLDYSLKAKTVGGKPNPSIKPRREKSE